MRLEVKVGCSLMLYPQGPAGFRLKARSQSEDFRIRKACLVRIQKCRLYRTYQEIRKTVDTWDLWDSLWTGADAHNSSTGLKFLMNNWSWLLPWVKQQLMPVCKSPDLFKTTIWLGSLQYLPILESQRLDLWKWFPRLHSLPSASRFIVVSQPSRSPSSLWGHCVCSLFCQDASIFIYCQGDR